MTPAPPPSQGAQRRDGQEAQGWAAARREMWGGLDQSSVMTVELLSGVLVWGGAGWFLDRWLGTWPWLFAIGVLLGFGAGLYLIWIRAVAAQRRFDEERAARRALGARRADAVGNDERQADA